MTLADAGPGTQDTQPIRPCQKFEGHTSWVNGVIHLPGRQRIMTCSNDGSLRIWNLQTEKQIANWQDGESGEIAIALSPDGKKVVSGSRDGAVRLWNIETGKVVAKWAVHAAGVRSVCWHPDGDRVLIGCFDRIARVWDVESGKSVLDIETRLSWVDAAVYSPDTTMIATSGHSDREEFISIWEANTGKLVTNLRGYTRSVNRQAWTPDGRTLICGSHDYSIRTWSTTTWEQNAVLTGHTTWVEAIAISPNGRILASASWDKTARLWNLDNGQPISLPLQHPYTVSCISFSTDGKLLATGCGDWNAYTWDVSVILREAGLDELLSNPNDGGKSLLDPDATRRPGQRRENARPLPPGFFDSSHHPDPSIIHPISPSSARHDTPPRPSFWESVRISFFNWQRRRNHESVELREPQPAVVDVPLGQGKPMYYTANEVRIKKEKEKAKKAKKADKASSSGSRPPQSNVTPQSAGAAQASEMHAAVLTSSNAPAVAITSASTTLAISDSDMPQPGYWTRFICCTSPQDTGRH